MSVQPAWPSNGAMPQAPEARLVASRDAIQRQLQAGAASTPLLDRLAREHPWALLAGAAIAGAMVVAARPWLRVPRPPVLASMIAQVAWQALAVWLSDRQPLRPTEGRTSAAAAPPR